MRYHRETSGERARDLLNPSDSRRWAIERDQAEPYGVWLHAVVGALLLFLLVWSTRC